MRQLAEAQERLTETVAQRRAALLRHARYPAVAVAGGTEATAGARQTASGIGLALLLDGASMGSKKLSTSC
ncbi:MAG TPA: hypothetical protein VLK82_28400 [Candidatus Tectomicrobia bacterium]|nr:hypothetical protein [Candidatus Tectomicrobia bacterium]